MQEGGREWERGSDRGREGVGGGVTTEFEYTRSENPGDHNNESLKVKPPPRSLS